MQKIKMTRSAILADRFNGSVRTAKPRLIVVMLALFSVVSVVNAEQEQITLNLQQAYERALKHDARISEKEYLVEVARGLLVEAKGAESWIYDVTSFLGLSPALKGGEYVNEDNELVIPDDAYEFDGVSPWLNMEFQVVYPINTFGRIENYVKAAEENITIKRQDVRLQHAKTYVDVARAYNGYLAARQTRLFLQEADGTIKNAIELVENWLENEEGEATQADLFALKTGEAILNGFIAEASGLEKIAYAGLKLLAGVDKDVELNAADKKITPLPLPKENLQQLQQLALQQRAEMTQVKSGLKARRALVEAKKSEQMPAIFTGVGGRISYSPERERLDSISDDPFNSYGATPVIGLKWEWYSGRHEGQVMQAQAELNALIEKKSFAQHGIPFQVAEKYYQSQAFYEKVQHLENGARSGRRWMVSRFADFEAGVGEAAKVMEAFQAYLLAYGEYLKTVNDYNMHIANLKVVIGEIK